MNASDSPSANPQGSLQDAWLGVGEYARCGWRRAWIMWDMDNGHAWGQNDAGKGYLWVFSTRKDAMTHRKAQHSKKHHAKLSMPFKIEGPRYDS